MSRRCCANPAWSLEFARAPKQPAPMKNWLLCLAFGMAVTFAPATAQAQSADLVLCDRLAADPSDPDKPADVKGVAEVASSDIATAIKYCGVAAKSQRRAMYQL